jgi:hypothetical protein
MRRHFNFVLSALFISIFFTLSPDVFARWETGVKAGFDSNIDRALDGGRSDSYMTGFLSFTREPAQNSNLDWTLNLALEGSGYKESNYLNYGMASITPSIIFYPHPKWSVNISPFIQAIEVNDTDQSGVTVGGEISMKQLWSQKYYTGEYVVYSDSRADVDIYSYKEKTVGAFAGVNLTKALWSEIGYEFSSEDSFRSVGVVSITQSGMGKGKMYGYSESYHEYLINEPVERRTIGVNMGYQFSRHIFSFINYAYASYSGDTGTSESHAGAVGIGYSF